MSDVAIRVENLSKRYRLGVQEEKHDTLVGSLIALIKKPGQNLQRLRRLTRFSENGTNEKDILWALRDVSFEVKQGEVVGVIGRNGAGKSTLLKILSRITYPTTGRVELHGRVASLLEVGTGFHPELTGRENVYLNGTILGMRKKEVDRKFDEIVDFSDIEKFIDTPVKYYSSGMRVRLAFSVAAHLDPEILLIDEVLAVGDVAFQQKCLGRMENVARTGRTVFFVSHDMGMIRALCPQCLYFQQGFLVGNDLTGIIMKRYLEETVESANYSSEVSWVPETAPSSDEVSLNRVSLLDQNNVVRDMFDVQEPISVEVSYNVKKQIHGMRIAIVITTQEGEVAFASTDFLSRGGLTLPGRYITKCTIPGDLFNNRNYLVQLHADIPNVKYLLPPAQSYLLFRVVGREFPGAKNPQNWPGIVSPRLIWETTMA